MPWELKVPVDVPINIDVQCYPFERQIPRIRRPIHDLAMEMLKHGELKPYQIAQALDSVGQFWERFASGDADLEDFEDDFDGQKRRELKKAQRWLEHAISILEPEDECPVCKCGTVELNDVGALVCRGECGSTLREAPEPEGEDDAEGERAGDDGHNGSGEAEDQGAR